LGLMHQFERFPYHPHALHYTGITLHWHYLG
jgi:hypothetical protein